MSNLSSKLFAFIFVALLLSPGLQFCFGVFKEIPLVGVQSELNPVKLSWQSIKSRSYQRALESSVESEIGFKGLFIRTWNQINFKLFKIFTTQTYHPLLLGSNGMIFEKNYADSLRNSTRYPLSSTFLDSLKQLQDKLDSLNINFLVLISPSKAAFFPEYLPKAYTHDLALDPRYKSRKIDHAFHSHGIRYFNSGDYLREFKTNPQFVVFPKGGTHWSYQAAGQVLRHLSKTEQTQGRKFFEFEPIFKTIQKDPVDTDNDLARLSNLGYAPTDEALFYYMSDTLLQAKSEKTNALIIGSSFSWTLVTEILNNRSHQQLDFLYYNKTLWTYPSGQNQDARDLDKNLLVQKVDLVIIEVNESCVNELGWGFINEYLEALSI
jgi:hypothetical protein